MPKPGAAPAPPLGAHDGATPIALRHPGQVGRVPDDGRGVEVLEGAMEIALGLARVERGRHRAVGHRAKIGGDPRAAVVAEERHPVATLDAEPVEARAVARDEPGSLAIGDGAPAVGLVGKDRLGRALRPVEQEFRQGFHHCIG